MISDDFNRNARSADERKPRKTHASPISFRVTEEERALLLKAAGKETVSAYARKILLGASASPRGHRYTARQTRRPTADHAIIAKVLGQLGASRLASNLNQIAKLAHKGALPVAQELEEDLHQACRGVAAMRRDLIAALGLKPQ